MGIETVAAIMAPIVIGAISKAMSDSNQGGVDAAQAKKNAAMGVEADKMDANRPKLNQSINNGMRQQSTAYQGANDMMATMGLGGKAPSGLNYNPMGNMFPQNQIPGAPNPVAAMAKPSPEAMAHESPSTTSTVDDSVKMRAAMNPIGSLGPPALRPAPPLPTDPYIAALKGPR